ncbi:peptidoglycan recognition protein family protein [Streptomyces himalayensis]|uniref:Peptidoglycan recognition protein n=1 Tax=Streptomyces himalayensis subsp. himalayensis TaxID=2756131 RepID=A0A7W0DNU9_9ACTN|nr:peptidoglycan recognition protein [Streptomyces himalayensis]MBA2948532.1 peptidoglycan recognition protein [Streptomyces himalayensis subsp. himalayensis]
MRVLRIVLCCVPGAVAFALLVLCAVGVGGHSASPGRTQTARPKSAQGAAWTAPRPQIVPRAQWLGQGGQEAFSRPPPRFADRVTAVFVHHTDTPNDYDCADAPRTIRDMYTGQAGARHWDDIGYNFLVDRCGTIYEGRAGSADQPVVGAHTQGFNERTVGVAAIGTFTAGTDVPKVMTDAIAAIAAWKLGLSGIDPRSQVDLVSTNSLSKYPAGTRARFHAVSGHTDGNLTECPGEALMAQLPSIRDAAARMEGRRP